MRKNLLILTGGTSPEKDVSIKSRNNLVKGININYFNKINVMILSDKTWIFEENNSECHLIKKNDTHVLLVDKNEIKIDVVFPIVLGDAESGELIGFFDSLGLPYIGSDVLSSAICFDKIFNKKIAQTYNIKTLPFIEYKFEKICYLEASKRLGSQNLIIKASRSGSSLGVSLASSQFEFDKAVIDAIRYDDNILIEKYIENVREIFCSIYEDEQGNIKFSKIAEVFYDGKIFTYEIKNTPSLKHFVIPAEIPENITNLIQEQSVLIFKIFRCKGFARIDFFIDGNDIYYSEINTIPGSSESSSFIRMLEASGVTKDYFLQCLLAKYYV